YVPQMERLRRELLLEALRFNEGFLQDNASDIGVQREAALAHYGVGHIQEMLGARDKAEQAFRRAIDASPKLATDSGGQPEFLRSMSRVQSDLASLLDDQGRHDEAEKVYKEAQAICADLASRVPGEAEFRHGLALTHYNLAMLLARTGRPAKAEED